VSLHVGDRSPPAPADGATPDRAAALRQPAYLLLLLAGIALEVFSGNSQYLGFPIGPDRLCLAAALLLLALDPVALPEARLRARPLHLAMLLLLAWATLSAVAAGSLVSRAGLYGLLDRLGALPFLLFALAPALFGTTRRRNLLLAVLVGLGLYLGVTAVLEGTGANALVFPRYITDPALGLHYGRARGPFLEAVANGLVLALCGVAAGMGLALWRSRWSRAAAGTCLALCGVGVLLSLTRAVWLGAVCATVAVLVAVPRLRRWLVPALALGLVAVVALLLVVPGLSDKANARTADSRSEDDRRNANATAFRVIAEHPLTGVGWEAFAGAERDYLRQADTYPVTNTGIAVHNVPLSHAAELGLPAGLLWVAVLLVAVGRPLLRRSPSHEGQVWRAGLLAVAVIFLVVADLGPLGYALPNLLLWLFAGIAQPDDVARHVEATG
jgi:putative inorganic carbon (hco3(-)) transporter